MEERAEATNVARVAQAQETSRVRRVDATSEATALIERLCAKYGALMFHQTGDAREDAVPLCYPEDEFFLSHCDVCLGSVADVPYFISSPQYELWKDRRLTVDVTSGRGGPFSLESGLGLRFVLLSRPFTDEEAAVLAPVRRGCPDGGPAAHAG